jgi:hypothetical protein
MHKTPIMCPSLGGLMNDGMPYVLGKELSDIV